MKLTQSGSNQGKRSKGKPKPNPGNYKATTKAPLCLPTPKYLSKTSSEVTNDPLYQEAYFPGPSEELFPEPDRHEIHTVFPALPVLIEESFKRASATKVGFSKRVPESAYALYIATHAWA
jgi:hypothetical protein